MSAGQKVCVLGAEKDAGQVVEPQVGPSQDDVWMGDAAGELRGEQEEAEAMEEIFWREGVMEPGSWHQGVHVSAPFGRGA